MGSGSSDHATAGSHGPTATGQLQLVTFDLGGESFAVDIHAVREINRLIELTRVPNSPPEIAGVINLRGKIFPVVNLRKKFGFPEKEHDDQTRIVVLEFGGRETGFIVDRVHEVLRIDRTVVDATPEVMSTVDADFIDGIAKLDTGLLIVLNLRKLFGVLQLAEVEDLDLAA
ncbi:MAG: chemotaxis protein CheW [Phycisphaeraceae bacterium]|nr:MAG: chemotaxis protein CheW [Phycisphaeraceae bacterium]